MSVKRLPELIAGRELQQMEEDRFRHHDIAEQLAELGASVETPANVALYGPWGSGKTGVANLLDEILQASDFRKSHGKVAFVRFDAFKYKEIPLRRYFLSQVTEKLLGEDEAKGIRERLYRSESRYDLRFPAADLAKALAAFGVLLVGVLALAALLAVGGGGLLSWFAGGSFRDAFGDVFTAVLAFGFAPAAVIGGLFAIAGKALPVQRTAGTPSTDEQFEDEFRRVVKDALKKHKAERLLVFVDELDRCAPDRVVDILDTVRTFLDVQYTVFVVAADRQVLEQALTERVEQTTPPDPTNPYYSSGSAYLDKVFQYQMSMPALLPGRITQYALDLVAGRDGLWSDERINVPWVVSVLIPTHVRSPRRVKTLLNNFVLAYRLAQRRFEEGHLTEDPATRTYELAKLVCLRTEFPTFARELTLSSRLPELFLVLARDPKSSKPSNVSDEVWEKARGFASDKIPVDEMLDSRPLDSDQDGEAEEDEAQGVESSTERASTDTQAALRQQLHHYLLKTRHISPPRRDLIFLEGQGYLFGLDESITEQVGDAAADGRAHDVLSMIQQQDHVDQTKIVRLLAQRTREAFPGIEGQNLLSVLLHVSGLLAPEVVEPCADSAIEAVSAHSTHTDLRVEDLPGALLLAVRSDRAEAVGLADYVLAQEEVLTNPELGLLALTSAQRLLDHHFSRLTRIVAERLLDARTFSVAVEALEDLGEHGEKLAGEAGSPITERLDEMMGQDSDSEQAEDGGAAAVEALHGAIDLAQQHAARGIAEVLLIAALEAEDQRCWESLDTQLTAQAPIDSAALSRVVLRRASDVEFGPLTSWLKTLADSVTAHDETSTLCDGLVKSLWSQRESLGAAHASHDDEFLAAMVQVRRVQPSDAARARAALVQEFKGDLGGSPSNAAQAAQADVAWGHLRRFAEEGLLPETDVAETFASGLAAILGAQPNPPQAASDESYRDWAERWSRWAAPLCGASSATELVEAIRDCTWLPTPRKENLCLVAAAGAARNLSDGEKVDA